MTLRAVSLFSGAGGFDLGFEDAGFSIVFANEINEDSAASWKANRPSNENAMHIGDIADVQDQIEILSDIDVVFGGPPCQGFSIAGKMKDDDPRNMLVESFMSVVSSLRPTVFVMENVKALATHQKWCKVRETLISMAEEAEYSAKFGVFQVEDFGVSEHRERMLFVGVRHDKGDVSDFFEGMKLHHTDPVTLRDILNSVGTYNSMKNPATSAAKVTIAKKPVLRKTAYSGMLVNGSGRPMNLDSVSPTLTASMGGNGTPIIDQRALESPQTTNWFVNLHKKMLEENCWDVQVPAHIRRLTVKEAAAIQSFPAWYVFEGSKCSQYRQVGNAVPPLFSSAVAKTVLDVYFLNEEG